MPRDKMPCPSPLEFKKWGSLAYLPEEERERILALPRPQREAQIKIMNRKINERLYRREYRARPKADGFNQHSTAEA